jgi:SMODS-associating 2TM, beta-strand rich effector domain
VTPIKNSVRVTAVVVNAVYSAVLFLSGVELDSLTKKILALLPAALAAVVVVFDKWAWKWPRVRDWHHTPRVEGLWLASLTPHADSHIPEGGNRGPIEAYVVIEQTFWTISIAQFTAESASYSRTATFLRHGQSAQRTLSYLYDNDPRQEHRPRSPRHVGACELRTPRGCPSSLEGSYFTDRYTQGEMTLTLIDRTTNYVDFKAAKTHADSRTQP